MSEYRNGAWSHPGSFADFISPSDGDEALSPKVAMDDKGNALIAWVQEEAVADCGVVAGCQQAYLSEYRNGSWSHPSDRATDGIAPSTNPWNPALVIPQKTPKVAIDDNGDAIIVWTQADDSSDCLGPCDRIYVSEYRDGAWTHPSGPSDAFSQAGARSSHASAAMSDDGSAVIAWQSRAQGGEHLQIYMSHYFP